MAYLKLSLDLWSVLFWWSKDENDEYLDLTWVSPNYTLETSKQKKQTLRRSPVYINFCKTVTMIARQNVYFSCVILYTLRGRVRQDETTMPKGGNS